ncbi:murein DD-endopeptidase MepM [bacterium BMS3Bbin09]|nr:murein DD-endopeptidase MepM [bacterium BMS3Bbin09]HDH33899.1 M23 family metallopeptidase [Nitrospirota bacterium]HDN95014.1 M23 family metallopeptidase [Nitrospirota bacterium]
MKHFLFSIVAIFFLISLLFYNNSREITAKAKVAEPMEKFLKISGIVRPKDTLDAIFTKHNLQKTDMPMILTSAKNVYNLSNLSIGNVYSFELDKNDNRLINMRYGIDDLSFLDVTRNNEGFSAKKVDIEFTRKIGTISFSIKDNLFYSMPGTHNEYLKLALKLSDIYAWDIDFSSDIRNGDTLKILVEELWAGEAFNGFGEILAVEFVNNGKTYNAYRFEADGYTAYYDARGRSLRKALLRSPLKFKYISSYFSKSRYHPILRIKRPHLGIDYAAPTGTPVSTAGNGTVVFAGYKGQNGNTVRIRHNGSYETYYGHLSRIPRKIRRGARVSQGDIIGYVGTTGLSTGPHLDYRMKHNGKFINPLKITLPRGTSIPVELIAGFKERVLALDARLTALTKPVIASSGKIKTSG